ncbi:MAG: hypothetical protein EHM24_31845 [Acidobacteria bacterium]|nr:MAG: hypothetical protein EHM24_31845 [Acidobacteriota bacterium]RPJ80081.1 MAG: hypothetical protein EHM13_12615 [Acidobacteriota bacterium]
MARLLLVLALAMLLVTGCVRARGNTRVQPPPLDVPPPPARVVVPPEPEQPPDELVTEEPASTAKRPIRPRAQPPRERQETSKPAESKPPETPPVEAAVPPPASPPTAPVPTLQPVLPASPGEMERQVNQQLAQARKDLDRVDYQALNTDGKSQYEQAKRFIEQAGQAQRDKNLVFAAKLAEKAVGLAAGLVAR